MPKKITVCYLLNLDFTINISKRIANDKGRKTSTCTNCCRISRYWHHPKGIWDSCAGQVNGRLMFHKFPTVERHSIICFPEIFVIVIGTCEGWSDTCWTILHLLQIPGLRQFNGIRSAWSLGKLCRTWFTFKEQWSQWHFDCGKESLAIAFNYTFARKLFES